MVLKNRVCHFNINFLVSTTCLHSKKKGNEHFYIIFDEMKHINFHFSSNMPTIVHHGNKGKGPFCRWTLCPGKHTVKHTPHTNDFPLDITCTCMSLYN